MWNYAKLKISWRIFQTSYLKNWKLKVYSSFKDKFWGADLADTQLKGKFNKGFRFFCVWLIFIGMENNNKDPKFKVGGHIRISKYRNIFPKG